MYSPLISLIVPIIKGAGIGLDSIRAAASKPPKKRRVSTRRRRSVGSAALASAVHLEGSDEEWSLVK